MPKANILTLEQAALIPVYQAKWREITLSTEPIDPAVATKLLQELYAKLNLSPPEVLFFDSPYAALTSGIFNQVGDSIRYQLENLLENLLWSLLGREPLLQDPDDRLWQLTESQYASNLGFLLQSQLEDELRDYPQNWLWSHLDNCLQPQLWQDWHGSWFDFFISVLHYPHDARKWEILQTLGQHSGWLFPYHDRCIVCRRPTKLLRDDGNQFHAEGEPAIQFADGFGVYVYRGTRLPQKYGALPPTQWRSQWILEETNPELKRILIQEIGYSKICQELPVTELGTWQNKKLIHLQASQTSYSSQEEARILWIELSICEEHLLHEGSDREIVALDTS
ncbi:MAG: hypothetical protein KME17_23665 [Cyanosarcina radialis HA8281-LM2]|nr:hypothetical protein [Cyanosarcina radialis HA8281-LM2]